MKGTQIIVGRDEHQKAFFIGLSAFIDIINKELSKEYPPEPLGKHIKVLGGYAFKSTEYKSEGIPVIRISDFQDEKIGLSNVQYYKENKEYDRYQLFEGDIIIALTGGTIGKLGIVQKGLGKLYLNQRVGKFSVLHPKEFYDRYVYWLARGVQEKVKSFGYGGAQPNISGSQIEEIQFSIPDKKTQEKIVEFLEDLKNNELKDKEYFNKETENKIKILLRIIEGILTSQNLQIDNISYISSLRQQILQEAVQGKLVKQNPNDEPASELLKKIKSEKDRLIKEGKIRKEKPFKPISEDEIPYDLPKGWEWVRLGDVCRFADNLDIQKKLPPHAIINYVDIDSIDNKNFRITEPKKEIVTKLSSRARRVLKKGMILYSLVRPYLNNLAIIEDERDNMIGSTGFAVFSAILIEKKYIFYFLLNPILRQYYLDLLKGFNSPGISFEKFENTLIPLPSLSEQIRIVEKVDKLMKLCDEMEKQVKENQENAEKLMVAVLKESFDG